MRRLSITFLGLCVGMLLHSQDLSITFPEEILKDYTITQLNTEDGFLQDGITNLWKDHLGYIWLFNQSGLIRLEESKKELYTQHNNDLITSSRVDNKIPLRDGSLLVNYFSAKGAFLLSADGRLKQLAQKDILNLRNYLEQLPPRVLCQTKNRFLPDFDKSNTRHAENFLYSDPSNAAFYVIDHDTIYYYIRKQLNKKIALKNTDLISIDISWPWGTVLNINKKLFFLSLTDKKLGPFIQGIEAGELGQRHKITDEAFLASLNRARYFKYFHYLDERCVIQVDKTIWELSLEGDFVKFSKILDHLPIRPTAIFFDPNKKVIFLSDGQFGLFMLKKKENFEYLDQSITTLSDIYSISFDEIQPGLIAYYNKLYSLQGKVLKTLSNDLLPTFWKRLTPNYIIASDNRPQVWDNVDAPTSTKLAFRPNLFYKKDHLKDALIDPIQHLWLASSSYITVYDEKKQTILAEYSTKKKEIQPPFCLALHPNQKEVWAGTSNGIYSFDIQSFQVKKLPFLENSIVRAIQFIEDQALIGTYGDGIFTVKAGKALSLPNDPNGSLLFAHAFVEDDDEFIWISTNNGLLKAAKAEMRCFLQGECADIYYHRFTTKDGLKSNEFNGGYQPCGIKLSNGHLAFASMSGILYFDPAEISIPPLPKQILIEEALLDGEAIPIDSGIVLPPRFQKLELRVKTDAYWGNRNNLIFQYRISGYEDSWTAVPDDGLITINRIDKGTFNLEFRIHQGLDAAKKGVDKYVYKQIDLTFQARLVETFYFYMLLFSLALLVAYLIYRARLYYLRKQNQALAVLVKSKTAELLNVNLELKESNSIKNLMLGIFNHDIASNLRYLSLLTHGIQTSLSSTQLDHETQEDFDLLTTTIHNLNAQTQGYLQWILLNRQDSKLSLANIQLLPIVQQVQDSLQQLANENNKKIVVDLEAPLWVYSHPLIIKSLLLNIIDNYIKYGNSDELTITGNVQANSLQIAYGTSTDFDFLSLNRFFNEENNEGKEAIFISPERKNSGGLGFYIIRDLLKKNQAQLQLSKPDSNLLYEIKFPNSKPM